VKSKGGREVAEKVSAAACELVQKDGSTIQNQRITIPGSNAFQPLIVILEKAK